MDKLNVSQWKEFKVGDLLTKVKTKKVPFKALDLPVNSTDVCTLPLVAAGVDNQGMNRYVEPKYATVLRNCLTVSANGANSGATFFQDVDFSILQDSYALVVLRKYKHLVTKNSYLFLAAVVRKGLINNDWSNKATWTRVQKTIIKLPVTSSGEPDWQYMDSYIAKLTTRAYQEVSLLERGEEKSEPLNVSGWEEFKVDDLFDVDTATNVLARWIDENSGLTPYVTSSELNNGVKSLIHAKSDWINSGNCIFIGGKTFTVTYQKQDFVSNDSHNLILRLRDSVDDLLISNVYLFLASVIKLVGTDVYSWGNAVTSFRIKQLSIKLPVQSNGHPDWQYMNDYVEFMKSIADRHVGSFQSVIDK